MENKILPGVHLSSTFVVGDNHSAAYLGSGTLNVLATPALVAFLENTAMKSIQDFLDEGLTTVGTFIELNHMKASAIGSEITAESILKSVDGKKLIFEVRAFCKESKTAEGIHHRFVVKSQAFLDKL